MHIAEWVGLPETAVGGILVEVYDSYLAVIDELGVEPMPGARSLVAALAGRLPLAVASNTREHMVRATLAASGLPPVFEHVFSPSEERRPKPAPDVYLAACDALGRARVRRRRVRGLAARAGLSARRGHVRDRACPRKASARSRPTWCCGSLLDLDLAVLGL